MWPLILSASFLSLYFLTTHQSVYVMSIHLSIQCQTPSTHLLHLPLFSQSASVSQSNQCHILNTQSIINAFHSIRLLLLLINNAYVCWHLSMITPHIWFCKLLKIKGTLGFKDGNTVFNFLSIISTVHGGYIYKSIFSVCIL